MDRADQCFTVLWRLWLPQQIPPETTNHQTENAASYLQYIVAMTTSVICHFKFYAYCIMGDLESINTFNQNEMTEIKFVTTQHTDIKCSDFNWIMSVLGFLLDRFNIYWHINSIHSILLFHDIKSQWTKFDFVATDK